MESPMSSRTAIPVEDRTAHKGSLRWTQLAIGLVCMMAISSPQYVWALFTKPMAAQLGVTLAELQVTFSILIVLQTFLAPVQGFLVEKFGPRRLLSVGAVLTGGSWVLSASAESLVTLYVTYGLLGGIGTGIIYIGVIGLMVKWFPDKRGLATGLVAAGYGMGAVLTTFPISNSLAASGYQHTLSRRIAAL
jgi:OFA family oxalate/formate antiporter-like MFS transporter